MKIILKPIITGRLHVVEMVNSVSLVSIKFIANRGLCDMLFDLIFFYEIFKYWPWSFHQFSLIYFHVFIISLPKRVYNKNPTNIACNAVLLYS